MIHYCPVCQRAREYFPGDPSGCSDECRTTLDARRVEKGAPALRVGSRVIVTADWSSFHGHIGTVDSLDPVVVCLPDVGAIPIEAKALRELP